MLCLETICVLARNMSEVPSGVSMPDFERKPPRPSATLMITRDGDDGVEVLLGQRCETMPSFPGYWAFPGGGVSRVDKAASEVIGISAVSYTHLTLPTKA